MSDPANTLRIRAELSGADPDGARFILDTEILPDARATFKTREEATDAPLPLEIFALNGVQQVSIAGAVITVRKDSAADWAELKRPIGAAIREVLMCEAEPLGTARDASTGPGTDAEIKERVQNVLDLQANPAIASHGGHVAVEAVEDGVVSLRMSGGCQGCAASAATLRGGVEQMIRAAVPEIRGIVDVTDHAAGTDPYYRSAGAGAVSPARSRFRRPVPDGAIVWEDGQYLINPEYLSSRLGLDADQLREGMQAGTIVSRSELGVGSDAGKARLIVRSQSRAWAAEIHSDGTALEIPPPRENSSKRPRSGSGEVPLKDRIRAHLEGLETGAEPITYGVLARALGLWRPGSVKQVTAALEETMAEDAEAGRPFIAARVVSRTRKPLPAQGFFDAAARLGRGPRNGENQSEYYAREIAALRERAG